MKIETKFDMDDLVHLINQAPTRTWESCEFCGGTGTISGADGSNRGCPECYSRGGGTVHGLHEWQLNGTLTIGEVRFEYRGEHYADEETDFDNYGSQTEKRTEKYMARETGIGTGTLWRAENLFATEEEAVAECERRNVEEESR